MICEILVCTYNEGINRIQEMLLPPMKDTHWLISFQYTDISYLDCVPRHMIERTDVTLLFLEGSGLSANRNNALFHATGDILLLADDDCRILPTHLQTIRHIFQDNPSVDIACCQAETIDGQPFRQYPVHEFNYNETPRGYWYCSMGIALKMSNRIPAFDTRFGINSPCLACGEEEVWLYQAHKNKAAIRYFPKSIIRTRSVSTGNLFDTHTKVQRSKGAVLTIMHGPLGALARCTKYIFYSRLSGWKAFEAFCAMIYGIIYIMVSHEPNRTNCTLPQ